MSVSSGVSSMFERSMTGVWGLDPFKECRLSERSSGPSPRRGHGLVGERGVFCRLDLESVRFAQRVHRCDFAPRSVHSWGPPCDSGA